MILKKDKDRKSKGLHNFLKDFGNNDICNREAGDILDLD